MILDVGCGIPSPYHKPLKSENVIHIDINKTAEDLNVQCDAYNLPFKNDCFSIVYASHILEHLENPTKAILEMKRVSSAYTLIKVPNASYYKWKNSSKRHISSWNQYTLRNLLEQYFCYVQINNSTRGMSYTRKRKFLNLILCLLYGQKELTAVCHK